MGFWRRAAQVASFARDKTKDGKASDLKPATITGMNKWAFSLGISTDDLPFPFWSQGSKQMGRNWELTGWGWLWGYQRTVYLKHHGRDVESFWINGRTSPQSRV